LEKTKNLILDLLRDVPFFEDFEDSEIAELASFMSLQHVDEGTVLFNEGDVGDYLFFIVEGIVEIILTNKDKQTSVIASVSVGESVGEMSLIDEYERSATVKRATDMEILVLTKTRFDSIMEKSPRLSAKVLRGLAVNISNRLRTSQGRYKDLV